MTIDKTTQRDVMPISSELEEELLVWGGEYMARTGGKMRSGDYIVPAQHYVPGHRSVLIPARPHPQAYRNVQRVLEAAGYAVRDGDGSTLREGQHTLRRSGARALFDQRVGEGYDGALRQVQAMLHHTTGAMTEKYLGLDIDKQARNKAIAGKPMFVKSLPKSEFESAKLRVVS